MINQSLFNTQHHEQVGLEAILLRLVCRWCSIKILVWSPAILTEVFRGVIQSHQANDRIVPHLSPDHFLSYPFKFITHQSFYHSTLYSLNTESIIK
jgi:hypothetical protein